MRGFKTNFIVSIVAFSAVLLATVAAQAAEFRLRSDARPQGPVVHLGDVAEVFAANQADAQKLAAIELAPAAAAGKQRQLTIREIQDTLERRGLNMLDNHFTGANQVNVVGYVEPAAAKPVAKSKVLSQSSMQEAQRAVASAIVAHLQEAAGTNDPWVVSCDLTDQQAQFVLVDVHAIEVRGGEAPWAGKQTFDILVRSEKNPQAFSVGAQVTMPSAVVVTAKAVPRGSILQKSDLSIERVKQGSDIGDAFQSIDDVVGKEAVLAIAPGQILDPQYVRTPVLVKRGNVVTVTVVAPGVKLRTTGRARDDGSAGDSVTVESLLDRKTYLAKVTGIDQVELSATSTIAQNDTPAKTVDTNVSSSKRWAMKPKLTTTRTEGVEQAGYNQRIEGVQK